LAFPDTYNPQKILVLNAWNEWIDSSFLLPERHYEDSYPKAIRAVFGGR